MSDEEKVNQAVRIPDEADDPAADTYEEIILDIPKDLIIGGIDAFAKTKLSPISYGIVAEALEHAEKYDTPASYLFEKLGRAIFNEIISTAVQMHLAREEFEEVLKNLEEEWDGDTPGDGS